MVVVGVGLAVAGVVLMVVAALSIPAPIPRRAALLALGSLVLFGGLMTWTESVAPTETNLGSRLLAWGIALVVALIAWVGASWRWESDRRDLEEHRRWEAEWKTQRRQAAARSSSRAARTSTDVGQARTDS
jgi:drug/metabolite transporter (DMT)-like permease